jgi:predicted tellurium resistance membrane protein TerC
MSLDNVLAISGAAHGDMVLVVFGVGLSIPLVIWGSGLLARLMARFWWIVDVGAAILGWVAGEMILGDRVVQGWSGGHPSAVATRAVQVALAVAVVLIGRAWARRRGRTVVAVRAGSGH